MGANTGQPGFRGPVRPDGSFVYLPIPESAPTTGAVPTYGDLVEVLDVTLPADCRDVPVHLDPEFAEYPRCDRYTYGDEHGVKARPLSQLQAGAYVFFYATLTSTVAEDAARPAWMPPRWGAYVIGQFRLADDPVTGERYAQLSPRERRPFDTNAHVQREPFDARVLLRGDPDGSRLYETAVPLSAPPAGTEANVLVTDHSSDSGEGPWWRRPLRLDPADVAEWRCRADRFSA